MVPYDTAKRHRFQHCLVPSPHVCSRVSMISRVDSNRAVNILCFICTMALEWHEATSLGHPYHLKTMEHSSGLILS